MDTGAGPRRKSLPASASVPTFLFRKSSLKHESAGDLLSDPEDTHATPHPPGPPTEHKHGGSGKKKSILFNRRHTIADKVTATGLHVEDDPLFRHERQCENLHAQRRHTLVGILGFGKVPKKVTELVVKKRRGQELSWEDTEYFIKGLETGHVSKEQAGAMMMAIDLVGLSVLECESLMKAMMFSGQLLHWPGHWLDTLASLQSIGSTGNKAKPIVASAMAAIGLKFPIMSSRGTDVFASILNQMNTIPGFDGRKSFAQISALLEEVGCCVVKQPSHVAPAETLVRDLAAKVGVSDNNSIKAACLMARVCAMKLRAVLLEITCGPSESIHSRAEAEDLVHKLQEMAAVMGVRCKVVLTHVDGPVGQNIGQSLGIAEAIRCLNGDGPADLTELVSKIGGHVLQEMNRVDSAANGEKLVRKVLKDGSAKKKFQAMLLAQGVQKHTIKNLFKHRKDPKEMPSALPTAQYFTHLSTPESGFVHTIDVTICNKVMFELARMADDDNEDEEEAGAEPEQHAPCAGGIQLMVQVGSYLTRGECWAKIHHNVRLTEDMMDDLKRAINVKLEPPLYDMTIDMQEVKNPADEEQKHTQRRVKFIV